MDVELEGPFDRSASEQGRCLHGGKVDHLRTSACFRRMSARSTNRTRGRGQAVRQFGTNLERYLFLRRLQDSNETLFYALLTPPSFFRSSIRRRSAKAARNTATITIIPTVCF